MTNCILAVDQGTSSTKCVVFSSHGQVMASSSAPLATSYGPEGTAEQDPEEIIDSATSAVASAVEEFETTHRVQRDAITCAGIANQRETFVLWDDDGKPLHNCVVWQCKRSVGICNELKAAGAEQAIRSRSGLIIDPYFSGTKVTWLLRNDRQVGEAHKRGAVHFGTVDSWLLHHLTGGSIHATDHSNASRTMLMNLETLGWDDELASILGVEGVRLPEIHPSSYNYGQSDFGGVFSHPLPITAMIGDSHSAFFGERCFSSGSAKATLGTGSSILLNAGATAPDAHPSTVSTIGLSTPGRVDYALEGIIVSAGSVLTWLQRDLGLYSDASELEAIASGVDDTGGVVVVPGHAGLGAPFWQMDARGSIHGLTFGSTKSHLLRAALESIPYQIRAVLDAVRAESGIECRSIRADGGISMNRFVTQWLADTLDVPVHVSTHPDVTAQGAAFLAGLGAGVYDGIEEIAALHIDESIIEPGPNKSAAQHGYEAWRGVIDTQI